MGLGGRKMDWTEGIRFLTWKLLRKWCQEYADAVFDWLNALLSMNPFLSYHCSIKILSFFFLLTNIILFASLAGPRYGSGKNYIVLQCFFFFFNYIVLWFFYKFKRHCFNFLNKKISSNFNWVWLNYKFIHHIS